MKDIIVTTPKDKMELAAQEANECIRAGGGCYFRTFRVRPRELAHGSRVFYVEDGFIRGFATVSEIQNGSMICGTSGYDWGEGYHAFMDAKSWKWIKPIPMKGFQGWRYFDGSKVKVVGGWLEDKPRENYNERSKSKP